MIVALVPLEFVVGRAVSEQHAGRASGLNRAISRTASLLAIALFGIVAVIVFNSQLDQHMETLEVPLPVQQLLNAERSKLAAAEVPADVSASLRPSLERAIADSFAMSFRSVMTIAAGLALLSAGSGWWLVEDRT